MAINCDIYHPVVVLESRSGYPAEMFDDNPAIRRGAFVGSLYRAALEGERERVDAPAQKGGVWFRKVSGSS